MGFLLVYDKSVRSIAATARTRFGGPRRRMRASMPAWDMHESYGSHMPIDTEFHFRWRNLANFMPALLLLLVLLIGVALA